MVHRVERVPIPPNGHCKRFVEPCKIRVNTPSLSQSELVEWRTNSELRDATWRRVEHASRRIERRWERREEYPPSVEARRAVRCTVVPYIAREMFDRLASTRGNPVNRETHPDLETEECPVCLLFFTESPPPPDPTSPSCSSSNTEVVSLQCKHVLHAACWTNWVLRGTDVRMFDKENTVQAPATCPMCRAVHVRV